MDEPRRSSRDARDSRRRDSPTPEDDEARVGKRPRYDSPPSNGPPPRHAPDDHYVRPRERHPQRAQHAYNANPPAYQGPPAAHDLVPSETKPRRKSLEIQAVEKSRRVPCKVLLANLPYDVSDLAVKDFFEHNKIPVDRVKLLGINPVTNKCNGNAFVYLIDDRDLDYIKRLDRSPINGRNVRIFEHYPEKTVCVRNSKSSYEKHEIEAIFKALAISDIRLAPSNYHISIGAPPCTVWFVEFVDEHSFERALCFDRSRDGLFVCVSVPPVKSPSRDGNGNGHIKGNGGRDHWRPSTGSSTANININRYGDRDSRPRDPPYVGRGPTSFDRYRGPPIPSGGPGAYRDSRDRYPPNDYRDSEYRRDSREDLVRSGPSNTNPSQHNHSSRFNERDAGYPPRSRDGREATRNPEFDLDRSYPRRERDVEPAYASRYARDRHDRFDRRSDAPPRSERTPVEGFSRDPYRGRGRESDRQPRDSRDRYRERDWESSHRGRDRFGAPAARDYNQSIPYSRDRREPARIKKPYDPSTLPAERPEYFDPLITSAIEQADRFIQDVEEDLTIVISSLHFHDDRGYMSQQIRASLESVHPDINIRWIFPAGRRCGHCFVVFKDKASKDLAISMGKVSVFDRPANVHPLEKPFLVRFHKLPGDITPEKVAAELKTDFSIDGITHAPDFGEFSFFRCAETGDFVRLLSVDGFPHKCNRLVSVSYYQGKRPYSASEKRGKKDYDDDGRGRGGNGRRDYNDRGSYGDDRRGGRHSSSGGGYSQEGNGDADGGSSSRYDGAGGSRREWRVRVANLPANFETEDVAAFLDTKGIRNVGIEKDPKSHGAAIIRGLNNNDAVYAQVLDAEGPFVDLKGNEVPFVSTQAIAPLENDEEKSCEENKEKHEDEEKETLARTDQAKNDKKRGKVDTSEIQPQESKNKEDSALEKRGIKRPAEEKLEGWSPKKQALETEMDDPLVKNSSQTTPPQKRIEKSKQLAKISDRLDQVKKHILSDDCERARTIWDDVMKCVHANLERPKLVHTLRTDNDERVRKVWTGKGKTRDGKVAELDGYIVMRRTTTERMIKKMIKCMPEALEIPYLIPKDHLGYRHIINEEATVVFLRGNAEEEELHMKLPLNEHKNPSSQCILQGIINGLKQNKRLGLIRYTPKGGEHRLAALCIPPDREIFEALNIPWRWRELIGHDNLMMVIGKKATSDELRIPLGLPKKVRRKTTAPSASKKNKTSLPKFRSGVAIRLGVAAGAVAKPSPNPNKKKNSESLTSAPAETSIDTGATPDPSGQPNTHTLPAPTAPTKSN